MQLQTKMVKEIIYVGDPMCSWCWGFSPVINAIRRDFDHEAPLSMILGGLHAYDDFPMSNNYKTNIRHHWQDVNTATGATFDYRFFDRERFILDTEPACRAVVTIRQIKPELVLPFYESISRSFYSENKDTTVIKTFKLLVEELDIDFKEFDKKFHSGQTRIETKNDFQFSKKTGVTGFPTLFFKEGLNLALLTAGYKPYKVLKSAIENWLSSGITEAP
jgi:putative protein-disulfide isomerase